MDSASMWKRIVVSVLWAITAMSSGFFVEPLIPLGDWRWLSVAAIAAIGIVVVWLWPSKARANNRADGEIPLRKDVIDREFEGVWTKDERGYPIRFTSIDAMKAGATAPPPSPTPAYTVPVTLGFVEAPTKTDRHTRIVKHVRLGCREYLQFPSGDVSRLHYVEVPEAYVLGFPGMGIPWREDVANGVRRYTDVMVRGANSGPWNVDLIPSKARP